MLNDQRNYKIKLNGANNPCWVWTDFRLAKNYSQEDWQDHVEKLIPYNWVWAFVRDPDYVEKKSMLDILFNKNRQKKMNGCIGTF